MVLQPKKVHVALYRNNMMPSKPTMRPFLITQNIIYSGIITCSPPTLLNSIYKCITFLVNVGSTQ
jgi:hypothetical protein